MTFRLVDRVRETAISPGTGTAVLTGAALGYQTFSAGVGANNTTYYVIADQSGANWEVGYGTVGALGTTLARTTVLSSSNAGALVNFSSGTQDVWVDYPATRAVNLDSSGKLSFGGNGTGYADWASAAPTVAAGRMWYNGTDGSWNLGMGGGNITQQIGEELFYYGKASAAITDSPLQIIKQTGVVGASGVITFAPTTSGITDGNLIVGVATESLALNAFGRITTFGVIHGITTDGSAYGETWADGDVIWYNSVTGNPTKIKPVAPNIKVQIGTVINAGSGGSGSFSVEINHGSVLGGTDSNVQLTSATGGQILTYNQTGQYWANVSLGAGTGFAATAGVGGSLSIGASVAAIGTWMGTPSSANLAAAMTDETGSGLLVFNNSPTLITPTLGTPASGTLTNCTGLPNGGLLNSSVTFNGVSVALGGSGTISALTTNALTFNNGGAGAASGSTFNGSAAVTISYNSIGASPLAGSSSLTTTGTVTSGTWSGSFGAVSGANLTNLTAGNLSGTIPSGVLGNSTLYVGTTAIALNRASAALTLTGVSLSNLTIGTGLSGTSYNGSSAVTITNTAPDQVVGLSNGTAISVSGTYPNFTITNTAPALTWNTTIQTAAFTASANTGYFVNTTSGGVTVTLPASPAAGTIVAIIDYAGTCATNIITLGRNGSNINGSPLNGTLKVNRISVEIVYSNSTQGWIVSAGGNENNLNVAQPYSIDYLVVAGGGGGSLGGGGAGGYIATTGTSVAPGTSYSVTVGVGGATGSGSGQGSDGSSSVFNSQTAVGGGGGGGAGNIAPTGRNGGSGGGGGTYGANNGGSGTSGQGNAGGRGYQNTYDNSGGGGGANAVGSDAISNTAGGNGGAGKQWSNGSYYAGGGGGYTQGSSSGPATGGIGGGGNGNIAGSGTSNASGTANTGGGGGGGGTGSNGNGGSGVVIVRYAGTPIGTGGTITQNGGYTYHTFTSSGTYVA